MKKLFIIIIVFLLFSLNSVFAWEKHKGKNLQYLIKNGYEIIQVFSNGDSRYTYHLVDYENSYQVFIFLCILKTVSSVAFTNTCSTQATPGRAATSSATPGVRDCRLR